MNEEIETRLRESRYEPSGLELDELKRRAMAGSTRTAGARGSRSPRLVTSFLALAMLLSGGSAVVASTSGSSSGGQPSASISQYEQIVLGERVTPGSAQLVAPTGCVARAFNARVRGQGIVKVVITLDGKKIKTLKKPDAAGRFQVRIDPGRLKIGIHRIVATVTFGASTKKAPKKFRISFQRCAKKLAAPRFTG